MKLGTKIETREIPGAVVSGIGGEKPIPAGPGSSNSATQPAIDFAPDGAPSPEWIKEHLIARELTDWEVSLGVVADDPESLRWNMRALAMVWCGIGIVLGTVGSQLIALAIAYLKGH